VSNWLRTLIIVALISTAALSLILQSWIPIVVFLCIPTILIISATVIVILNHKKTTYVIISSSPERESYRSYVENNEYDHKNIN